MQRNIAYETTPYPSMTFPQSHPERLSTMAALHGMSPATPEKCRILELGCGSGANLLSFAYALPNSEFVGLDFAKVHIESADQTARKLGVSNVTFHCRDVIDFTPEQFGEFDFIISHGFFSWAPEPARAKILEIYAACLAPDGVGYISYNVYPGCHIREMTWDMLRFCVADIAEPAEKVRQGTSFLKFIQSAAGDVLYQSLIAQELSRIGERSVGNIMHDEFSEVNQPFYFREFVDRIEPLGLKFLCEAEPQSLNVSNLTKNSREMLDSFGDDINRREQYLDFIKCTRFRNSLVCRSNISLRRDPGSEVFEQFLIASKLRPASAAPRIEKDVVEIFVNSQGATFQTNHPLTKAAIICLDHESPRRITFNDLVKKSLELTGNAPALEIASETEKTASLFLQLFYAGFIDLHTSQPNFALAVSKRPAASAFAHWQLEQGSEIITTLKGTNLKLDDKFARTLLLLLDGTRDRASLVSALAEKMEDDETIKGSSPANLEQGVETALAKFAGFGLLVS